MTHDPAEQCLTIQAELAAYALGEQPLSAELRAHLDTCESCRQALQHYARVARVLPYAAPAATPSPALRARLLAAVATPVAPTNRPPTRSRLRAVRRPLLGWGLALAAMLGLAFWNIALHQRLQQQTAQLAASRANWQAMVWLLNDAAARPIALQGSGNATFWAAPDQTVACLVVQGLPHPPANHVYQIWLIREGIPRSAGTFLPQGADSWTIIRTDRSPLDYEAIRVTIEPAGGSATPSGPAVLEGSLTTSA